MDQLQTSEQSFWSFSTLYNVIKYKFCKAGSGSGSALRKTAGSGFAKNECGSTALLKCVDGKVVGRRPIWLCG